MCDLVYHSVRTLRVGCLTGQPYLQVERRTARIALYSRRSVRGCLTPLLQAARVHPFETTAALARCEERLVLLRGGAATNSALVFFNGLCLGLRLRHLVFGGRVSANCSRSARVTLGFYNIEDFAKRDPVPQNCSHGDSSMVDTAYVPGSRYRL